MRRPRMLENIGLPDIRGRRGFTCSASVRSGLLHVRQMLLIGDKVARVFRDLRIAHAPPGAVPVRHGLWQHPDIEQHGYTLDLLRLYHGRSELLEGTHGECSASVSFGDLGKVHGHERARMLPVLAAEAELCAERIIAMTDLQVVDAAEGCVVEQTDIDLLVLLHGGEQF